VPPISECDKAKGQDQQKKCRQDYKDCNDKPHPNQCKKDTIDHYTDKGGGNPSSPGGGNPSSPPGVCDHDGCDLVKLYVNPFIKVLSAIVGLVAAISLVMGGIQYSTSGGDPQKASAAKSRISKTILGVFIYGFLYAFLNFLVPGGIFK
jgi:hypothetical protein